MCKMKVSDRHDPAMTKHLQIEGPGKCEPQARLRNGYPEYGSGERDLGRRGARLRRHTTRLRRDTSIVMVYLI